ncbi:uncharacterized protein [Aristolochia californica]|uniref:uncharacterized protein n=1 Tax=Aristolochia californica TaxID=171875 RepID=UPI0035D58F3A
MTSQDKLLLPKEQSTYHSPLFNGTNYGYWKVRIELFLQSIYWDIWHVTKNYPFEPQKLENIIPVAKEFNELTREDKEWLKTNYETSKDILKKLDVTHEGTIRVKDSRISLLIAQYNEFKMKLGESIADMNSRFTHIINELNILGEEISLYRQNNKFLKALPKSWDMRKTIIRNANFRSISSKKLLGILLTYEMEPQDVEKD